MPDGSLFALIIDISITCGDPQSAPSTAFASLTAFVVVVVVAAAAAVAVVSEKSSSSPNPSCSLNRTLRVLWRDLLLVPLFLPLPPLLRNMSRTLETPKE